MDRQMLVSLQQRHLAGAGGMPHLTPNLYEMAALTQELDTTVRNQGDWMISLPLPLLPLCFLVTPH